MWYWKDLREWETSQIQLIEPKSLYDKYSRVVSMTNVTNAKIKRK